MISNSKSSEKFIKIMKKIMYSIKKLLILRIILKEFKML